MPKDRGGAGSALNLAYNNNNPNTFFQAINMPDGSIYDLVGRYFTIGARASL